MTPAQARHAAAVLRRVAPAETHEGRHACLDTAEFLDLLPDFEASLVGAPPSLHALPSEPREDPPAA